MTIKDVARQAAVESDGDSNRDLFEIHQMADAVAVAVLKQVQDALRSKLTPFDCFGKAAQIIDGLLKPFEAADPVVPQQQEIHDQARSDQPQPGSSAAVLRGEDRGRS